MGFGAARFHENKPLGLQMLNQHFACQLEGQRFAVPAGGDWL
jgi:hypothetical protein